MKFKFFVDYTLRQNDSTDMIKYIKEVLLFEKKKFIQKIDYHIN